MSKAAKAKPGADAPEEIEECPRCGKPLPLCICDSVTPIANRVELLILQHP
ncbi:MAG: DTW domain-containing protein, partial [Afipia sp.]|nr:DTW domain-containing protein [Afipia sp.]